MVNAVQLKQWSLTSRCEKLVKIGAKFVRHGRFVPSRIAEVAIPGDLFANIRRRIDRLRPKPVLARSTGCLPVP
jgi:hypothetical protein